MNSDASARKDFLSRFEFRKQLVAVFSAGIIFLAITSSLTLSNYLSREARSQIVSQGLKIAESFSRQSKLALLYKSPENAYEAAETSLNFPDVIGLSIRDEQGEIVLEQGTVPSVQGNPPSSGEPVLFSENELNWVFASPVISEPEQMDSWTDLMENSAAETVLLGHIYIVISKQTLQKLEREILNTNLSVSFSVALAILLLLLFVTNRLTRPLNDLANAMGLARSGRTNVRAKGDGPLDITNMQNAFNAMMDVLERRELELRHARDLALESAKVKGEFAANVSHELRTPMNAVIGMLDLLSSLKMSVREKEYLDTAKQAGQQLLALIDDILNFAEIDSGKLNIEVADVNLRDLVEDVVELLANQALRKNLDFGYVIEDDVPACVRADPWRIRQILINLVGNAIKFTSKGEIRIRVKSAGQTKNSPLIGFCVEDTGIGISAEAQKKIFQAFTQADSTTTKEYGGTGLGLTICRELAKLMGGEIGLVSESGRGSIFTVELPCEPVGTPEVEVIKAPYHGMRVLVADDSEIVQSFCAHFFNKQDVELMQARNGFAVVDMVRSATTNNRPIDLILLDEELPGYHLEDVLKQIGVLGEHSSPQIAISHNQWGEYELDADDLAIVHKPFTDTCLHRALVDLLQQNQESPTQMPAATRDYASLNKTVLIADDNRANRQVATAMLQKFGCRILTAENGEQAIDRLTRTACDLILMDCNMPLMDGYEATRLIRALEDDRSSVPIVAMTANHLQKDFDRCLEAGMDHVCPKPLTLQSLQDTLEKALGCTLSMDLKELSEPISIAHISSKSFDLSAMETLKETVGEVFYAMLEAFLEDTPVYIKSLKSAIEAADSQQVYELAHTVKGSAMNFAASEVVLLAKKLEDLGRSRELGQATRIYEQLETSYRQLSRDLDVLLVESGQGLNARTTEFQVLIADDDRSLRVGLKQALGSDGLTIREAENGEQAIAICRREIPDLILMDAVMPETDGFSACKQIRSMPQGVDVPILMITGLEDEVSVARAFSSGATDYIPKPVNFSVLRQRVSRLLENSKNARHIKQLAYQDPLTGLPNRTHLMQNLRHMISRASLKKENLAVLFMDLDRFKLINDSMGHDTGDLLLKAVAERIKGCIRDQDVVARLGGDEFTVILEGIPSADVATQVAGKICHALRNPFVFLKQKMFVSSSIGVSIYPDHGEDVSSLLKHADTAMFRAKERGDGYCVYQQGMADAVAQRVQLERELRQALDSEQIILYYQPQKCLRTGRIQSVEALVRWRHPDRGLLAADQFIPIAEETGLIEKVGKRVFELAFRQIHEWVQMGHQIRVAINLSGGEMAAGPLAGRVREMLHRYDLAAELLELEITESMLMEQPDLAEKELSSLRELGVKVAIDDFGTGFSSLSYLKRFSVDVLKIDRSFVKDCHSDKNDRAIIAGIMSLAGSLDLKVVAEGVETLEQEQILARSGCDYIQGYFLSKPAPPEEVARFFRSTNIQIVNDSNR